MLKKDMKTSWLRRSIMALSLVAFGMILSFFAFIAWVKIYDEDVNPKNIEYVLWTHGLNQNMNLDHALDGMTHDKWPVRLVRGLSKQQLKDRFGYIRNVDQNPRACYAWGLPASSGNGMEIVSLRESRWVVLLDHDSAVDLALCKG